MNFLNELSNNNMMQAFGWTLLHSLWQFFIITIVAWILIRFVFRNSSQTKYLIACFGLLLGVAASGVTFLTLGVQQSTDFTTGLSATTFRNISLVETASADSISTIVEIVQKYMDWIIYGWMAGATIFAFRLIGGWWYLNRLTSSAVTVHGDLKYLLDKLKAKLGVRKVVELAETTDIDSPMVIGYFKPVILIPVGLMSGLTTAEIETIFLHELAHIRRHDYLVNILQSCIEVIFFFNPFVWILSGAIRREREFCCDDAVVIHHANAIEYARALAALEHSRLSATLPALSLADNKNHLLIRIKRIMERTLKTRNGNNKLLPFILVILGLFCASWLTITTDRNTPLSFNDENQSDTTIRKNRSERRNIKPVPAPDPMPDFNPAPIIELPQDIEEPVAPVIALEEFPDVDILVNPAPVISPFPAIDPIGADLFINFDIDSFPRGLMLRNNDWERFSHDFENKFRERFGDFYEKNEVELSEMLEELEQKFSEERISELTQEAFMKADIEQLMAKMPEAQRSIEDAMRAKEEVMRAFGEKMKFSEKAMREKSEQQEFFKKDFEKWEKEMKNWEEDFKMMESDMRVMEENMKKFEKVLAEQLVKDGYISSDEKIRSMRWDDDGDIIINGKHIKETDRKKYIELHENLFGKSKRTLRKVE